MAKDTEDITGLDRAYPEALRLREKELLERRRDAVKKSGYKPSSCTVGVGLSGGGIRSATFCLGLFQGLARQRGLIGKIDYLSTVSGGGYFGGFFGRLCSRSDVTSLSDVEGILDPDHLPPRGTARGKLGSAVRHLRENGRYLSPNGSGDLLLGGAILFRNWVSIHVVLWSFVLMLFLLLQLLRVGVEVGLQVVDWGERAGGLMGSGAVALQVWWSPWVVLPLLCFVLLAIPLGWAYWLVERVGRRIVAALGQQIKKERVENVLPWAPLVVAGLAAALYLWWLIDDLRFTSWRAETLWIAVGVLVVAVLTPIHYFFAWGRVSRELKKKEEEARPEETDGSDDVQEVISWDALLRNHLSRRLKTALVLTGALLGVAVIDSLGQTLYVIAVDDGLTVGAWIGGLLAGFTALSGFARRMVVQYASAADGKRPGLPLNLIATTAAIIVVALLLVGVDALSHAVSWLGVAPTEIAGVLAPDTGDEPAIEARVIGARELDLRLQVEAGAETEEAELVSVFRGRRLLPALCSFLVAFAFSWAIRRIWPFVNRSSHHPLYSARLTRAYLGASNERRLCGKEAFVTRVVPGDDLGLERYWPPPHHNGMPLHLINVTINETVDGHSGIQQQDRRGTGMALGPGGLSVGVQHHVVGPFGARERPDAVRVYPEGSGRFRVFEYPVQNGSESRRYRGEPLTLGQWVGISGAAFSTGLGFRTSLGLALLAGLANVRLGSWWDSGVEVDDRVGVAGSGSQDLLGRFAKWSTWIFPVQSFLLNEFFARFPGTARRHWYLSDGGHFENLGGYELLRRRLPVIVIVDAEADPDYTFGGLANLVRKARLDFGAEIEFLDEEQIDKELPSEVACHVGTLPQLRRGAWKRKVKDRKGKRPVADLEAPDRKGFSLVHAAVARVRYLDEPGSDSWLLYVKPTLTGDEPEDVLDYHRSHGDFPQETTADQFFDEAQWESYRCLGQHIAQKVFCTDNGIPADRSACGFDPRSLDGRPPGAGGGSAEGA